VKDGARKGILVVVGLRESRVRAAIILSMLLLVMVVGNTTQRANAQCWNLVGGMISGSMQSSPALAHSTYDGGTWLLVRGSTNQPYARNLTNTNVWGPWMPLGGATIDTPAIGFIWDVGTYPYHWAYHIVVRGTDNKLYYKSYGADTTGVGTTPSWTSWISLAGSTPGEPVLIASSDSSYPYTGRLDLVVRGMDNGLYHKSWTYAGGWSSSWDTPGGKTQDRPAITVLHGQLYMVVRGIDNGIYWNRLDFGTGAWLGWSKIPGSTPSGPAIAVYDGGTTGRLDLVVRGMNNGIYHKSLIPPGYWSTAWDSPGGATPTRPVTSFDWPSSYTSDISIFVVGTDSILYRNVYQGGAGTWQGYETLCGSSAKTNASPVADDGLAVLSATGGKIYAYHPP
jgi:hypothetical protein